MTVCLVSTNVLHTEILCMDPFVPNQWKYYLFWFGHNIIRLNAYSSGADFLNGFEFHSYTNLEV